MNLIELINQAINKAWSLGYATAIAGNSYDCEAASKELNLLKEQIQQTITNIRMLADKVSLIVTP
jgi:hypothetical protein